MTRCAPWNHVDKQLLVGDAAHSVVPFYGQGANAAFEDCLAFVEKLDECGGDLAAAVPAFAESRRPAGDALGQLSLDNYVEMRHKTASPAWLLRKRLDGLLNWLFPTTWIPLYGMVAFTRIPYHEALARAKRQDEVLDGALMAAGAAALAAAAVAVWARRSLR